MNTTEEFIVGKYPAELLLDILSDGMEYAARGFWAQIKRYKWEWWYKDGISEIDTDKVKPDTTLITMREHSGESGSDVYYFENNHTPDVRATMHRIEDDRTTICGIIPTPEDWGENWDYSNFDLEAEDCPTCIKWVDITLEKLAEATDWARENYSHILAPWTVGKGGIIDDINYDAIGADVIIQKIVLGEVVYG